MPAVSYSSWVRLFDAISEAYEDLLDSSAWQRMLGWCLALFLNLLLILSRIGEGREKPPESNKDINVSRTEFFLLIFSLSNAFYVWVRKRRYHFFQRDHTQRPKVANARLVDMKLPYFAQNKIGEYLIRIYYEFLFDTPYRSQYVWQVNVWNPDNFALCLLCGFSPVHVGILILMNPRIWTYYVGVVAFLSLQMYANVYMFSSLVSDRQAIYGEVQREYDAKFVRPRLFVEKQNDSTQTNLDDIDNTWHSFESKLYPEGMNNPWVGSSSSDLRQDT
ncbi:18489_t:CDS:2 [Acaulospora morrowiae]|uniref:18489_t:CDS:1 n=1 Tax=Acaulospora morrowiae TaxID=94023 RepID=A0A9N9FF97_9GLOM|nr:18489_t:CDS:2 [Acaulospora morrowiae]